MKIKLLHTSKKKPTKPQRPSLKVTNSFKTIRDLASRTQVEKEACEIFSKFYETEVKTSSLPITLYANCQGGAFFCLGQQKKGTKWLLSPKRPYICIHNCV